MASELDPQPLPKKLWERTKQLELEIIELSFSGGSDEGYLTVDVRKKPEPGQFKPVEKSKEWIRLEKDIEEWAWSVYDYSGAGEGQDYGDNVVYDLVENQVTTSEWYTTVEEGDDCMTPLEIEAT